jgi:hypothetical protein
MLWAWWKKQTPGAIWVWLKHVHLHPQGTIDFHVFPYRITWNSKPYIWKFIQFWAILMCKEQVTGGFTMFRPLTLKTVARKQEWKPPTTWCCHIFMHGSWHAFEADNKSVQSCSERNIAVMNIVGLTTPVENLKIMGPNMAQKTPSAIRGRICPFFEPTLIYQSPSGSM